MNSDCTGSKGPNVPWEEFLGGNSSHVIVGIQTNVSSMQKTQSLFMTRNKLYNVQQCLVPSVWALTAQAETCKSVARVFWIPNSRDLSQAASSQHMRIDTVYSVPSESGRF